MASAPIVTVLLPAYNAAAWLETALDSVLNQSLRDFELLVIDDGSTDSTAQILSKYGDPRMQVVREGGNRGLVAVLNRGIDLARAPYIARMDADDICHPRRLERQLAFLAAREDVGICGTWFRAVGRGRPGLVRPPVRHEDIAATLFFRSAFGHPTVMFRRSFLEAAGLRYRPQARHAEDFDLWVRAREHTRLANLPEYLLQYRLHSDQTSAGQLQPQSEAADRIRLEQLAALLPEASDDERRLHLRACDRAIFASHDELVEVRSWLDRLRLANRARALFPARAFERALADTWGHCCHRARLPGVQRTAIFLSRRYGGIDAQVLRWTLMFGLSKLRHPANKALPPSSAS